MFEEYEFIVSDGSSRFEMVDLSSSVGAQMFALKRMHGAVAAWPLRLAGRFTEHRQRLMRKAREADSRNFLAS